MDLETLWYGVIGCSVLFYAVLDGFDLGVGGLHLFAKTDEQRRIFLNAIGPVWDGNEVWIVIVMGGLFAGFPNVYATIFSGFYTLLMFLIAGLMFRAVAIEFRSKRESPIWRQLWDSVFSVASVLVAFILGLLLGNLIEGVSIASNQDYVGTFADFFRFYPVLVGFTSAALFTMHGAIYLAMKTDGPTQAIVHRWIGKTVAVFLLFYLLLTIATLIDKPYMTVRMRQNPFLLLFPILALLALLNIVWQVRKNNHGWAFISSCLGIAFLLSLFALGTYPTLVYSTLDPDTNSLTIYNAASSHKTLGILLIVALIGIPLIFAYGLWIYHIFRGKVRLDKTSY